MGKSRSRSPKRKPRHCSICEYLFQAGLLKETETDPALPETVCTECGLAFCFLHLVKLVPNYKELLAVGQNKIVDTCFTCKNKFCKYGLLGDPNQNFELSFDGPKGPNPLYESCAMQLNGQDKVGLERVCTLDACAKDPKVFCSQECFDHHSYECSYPPKDRHHKSYCDKCKDYQMYDVLVVGAGPAGLAFCASKAIKSSRVICVEAGKELDQRTDDPKDIGMGVAGAGAYIDGKFSFFPAGTNVWNAPYNPLLKGYEELKGMLSKFPSITIPEMPVSSAIQCVSDQWHLKSYTSIYLNHKDRSQFLDDLIFRAKANAKIKVGTLVENIVREDGFYSVQIDTKQKPILCKRIVLAGGRFMPLQKLIPQIFVRHEFGVRIQVPFDNPGVRQMASHGPIDPKFVIDLPQVQFRTFCFCKRGQVIKSNILGIETYSGRADVEPTDKTNFGLMARIKDPLPEQEIQHFLTHPFHGSLDQLPDTIIGRILRLGIAKLLQKFQLDCQELEIIGPCLEGVGSYPAVDSAMHVIGSPNMYAIGDTNGTFRGLVPSLLSGFYLAQSLK